MARRTPRIPRPGDVDSHVERVPGRPDEIGLTRCAIHGCVRLTSSTLCAVHRFDPSGQLHRPRGRG
jgi:hypothetical protein